MRSSPCEMFKRISLLNDLEQRFIRQAFATSTPAQGANRPSLLAVQTLTPLAAIATNSGTTAGGIRMLRNHTCELALLDSFVSDEEIRARQIINQQNKLTYPQAAEKARRRELSTDSSRAESAAADHPWNCRGQAQPGCGRRAEGAILRSTYRMGSSAPLRAARMENVVARCLRPSIRAGGAVAPGKRPPGARRTDFVSSLLAPRAQVGWASCPPPGSPPPPRTGP